MSAIPAEIIDTMRELEQKYKSLVNVPPKDARLTRLNHFFGYEEQISKENQIKQLVNEGYTANEISGKVKASLDTVRKIAKRNHLTIRRKYGYVAFKKGGSRIFSSTFKSYRAIAEVNISNFESAQRGLEKEGYKLKKIRRPIRWGQLLPGDLYIENYEVCTKE